MIEIKEKNTIKDNDILINKEEKSQSYKTFNKLKEIQNLLKKDSNYKEICKINFLKLNCDFFQLLKLEEKQIQR